LNNELGDPPRQTQSSEDVENTGDMQKRHNVNRSLFFRRLEE